jgi:hypothetical protein
MTVLLGGGKHNTGVQVELTMEDEDAVHGGKENEEGDATVYRVTSPATKSLASRNLAQEALEAQKALDLQLKKGNHMHDVAPSREAWAECIVHAEDPSSLARGTPLARCSGRLIGEEEKAKGSIKVSVKVDLGGSTTGGGIYLGEEALEKEEKKGEAENEPAEGALSRYQELVAQRQLLLDPNLYQAGGVDVGRIIDTRQATKQASEQDLETVRDFSGRKGGVPFVPWCYLRGLLASLELASHRVVRTLDLCGDELGEMDQKKASRCSRCWGGSTRNAK